MINATANASRAILLDPEPIGREQENDGWLSVRYFQTNNDVQHLS